MHRRPQENRVGGPKSSSTPYSGAREQRYANPCPRMQKGPPRSRLGRLISSSTGVHGDPLGRTANEPSVPACFFASAPRAPKDGSADPCLRKRPGEMRVRTVRGAYITGLRGADG